MSANYLDLALSLARCRLVDRHLDGFIIVGDHNGAQGGEVSVDLLVIHRPEAVKHQCLFIPAHTHTHHTHTTHTHTHTHMRTLQQ